MSFWQAPPPPPTKLGRYRQLSTRAGIHVSPLCLGGMSIGDKWAALGMGSMNRETSFKLLDAYFDAGGNFIDTANLYQDGSSEEFIGEWAESRGIRDQLVIATKYANSPLGLSSDVKLQVNYRGSHVKSLMLSFDISLARLKTKYVDIFYVHWWDLRTSIEEIMDSLHNLVVQGKVLYLGISDAPAWVVVKANSYARYNNKTPFVVYQGAYSCLERDVEREILPMCRHEGMAFAPWNVLASGHIRTDEEEESRRQTGENGRTITGPWERTPEEKKLCAALEEVVKQVEAKSIQAVAIAYTMHKAPYVFPIIGGRKVEHLQANIEALSVSLTKEQLQLIDGVLPFNKGFPNNLMGEYGAGSYPIIMNLGSTVEPQPLPAPIPHSK